jgi:diphthamide synthase subunit DPH2
MKVAELREKAIEEMNTAEKRRVIEELKRIERELYAARKVVKTLEKNRAEFLEQDVNKLL